MTIDLRTCKPGDKLEMRNGEVAEYVNSTGDRLYPHSAKASSGVTGFFTDNGQFYSYRTSSADIVKVIPMPTDSTIPQRGLVLDHALSILQALHDGKQLQTFACQEWGDCSLDASCVIGILYNNPDCIRIKPKPTVIPWTYESCPIGKIVRRNFRRSMLLSADQDSVFVQYYGEVRYEVMHSYWTMDDGSPCGTVQQ